MADDPDTEVLDYLFEVFGTGETAEALDAAEVMLPHYRRWLNHSVKAEHPYRDKIAKVISGLREIVLDEDIDQHNRIRAAKLVLL